MPRPTVIAQCIKAPARQPAARPVIQSYAPAEPNGFRVKRRRQRALGVLVYGACGGAGNAMEQDAAGDTIELE